MYFIEEDSFPSRDGGSVVSVIHFQGGLICILAQPYSNVTMGIIVIKQYNSDVINFLMRTTGNVVKNQT